MCLRARRTGAVFAPSDDPGTGLPQPRKSRARDGPLLEKDGLNRGDSSGAATVVENGPQRRCCSRLWTTPLGVNGPPDEAPSPRIRAHFCRRGGNVAHERSCTPPDPRPG